MARLSWECVDSDRELRRSESAELHPALVRAVRATGEIVIVLPTTPGQFSERVPMRVLVSLSPEEATRLAERLRGACRSLER